MSPICIGLLWHSADSSNLGVGALTYSQLHLATQAAIEAGVSVEFIIIGWEQNGATSAIPGVRYRCGINLKQLLGIKPELRSAFKACDLVLDIGEGDSFSDIYGWLRLIYLVGTKFLASSEKRLLVLSPQTIGPFKGHLAAWLADLAMLRARAVCSRDVISTEYFVARKLRTPLIEAIDVAFALPFEPQAARLDGTTRIGINVSGLLWSGGYTRRNQFGLKLDYRATVLEIIDFFLTLPDTQVILVPHVVTAQCREEDDLRASQEIAAIRSPVQIAKPFDSPMHAKSFISGLDFLVGARMHACIAAFSSGVPCVPMAYSRKFLGLFGTLGYPHVVDCTAVDQSEAVRKITEGFKIRHVLLKQTIQGNAIAARHIANYSQLLRTLLVEAANAKNHA